MCVLCVQLIASWQSEVLEELVQVWKGDIPDYNARIAQLNSEMAELVEERAAISGKGEPPGCHGNDSR